MASFCKRSWVLVLPACGAPIPRTQGQTVFYTFADGIAIEGSAGDPIHFYRFNRRAKGD